MVLRVNRLMQEHRVLGEAGRQLMDRLSVVETEVVTPVATSKLPLRPTSCTTASTSISRRPKSCRASRRFSLWTIGLR